MTNVSKRHSGVPDGLRVVANLIDRNLPEPYFGRGSNLPMSFSLSTYGRERDEIVEEARTFIGALTVPPAIEVEPGATSGVWLRIGGRIHGLYVELRMNAEAVCDKRVTSIHQATDGSIHEIIQWSIPDEILNAWTGGESSASGGGA